MAMTARGGFNEADPELPIIAQLRFLGVGAELRSKGARHFSIYVRPFGVVIEACDRSLPLKLKFSRLIPFDKLEDELHKDRVRAILRDIDAALDREIRRAE